jgi:amino acid permease
LTLLTFIICYYTSYLVVKTAGTDKDYTETLQRQFGRKGWVFGMGVFILQLMIPIIIYFQLLAQNLYPIILAISGQNDQKISTDVDFEHFSYTYICIVVMVILMLLTLISKLDLFVKISTYSVIFVFMTLIFLVAIGIYSLTNTNFIFSDKDVPPT